MRREARNNVVYAGKPAGGGKKNVMRREQELYCVWDIATVFVHSAVWYNYAEA
jgi:hypothetical protein